MRQRTKYTTTSQAPPKKCPLNKTMETTQLDQLPLRVFYSEEDGEYVATVPGMPLISALAETEEEALSELQTVLETCAEVAQEKGMPFPPCA